MKFDRAAKGRSEGVIGILAIEGGLGLRCGRQKIM
jgi:hypothetical protein